MLKGWFDCVFVNGGLYMGSCCYDCGYFCGWWVICLVMIGVLVVMFGLGGCSGDIGLLLWLIYYLLYYMGYDVLLLVFVYGV